MTSLLDLKKCSGSGLDDSSLLEDVETPSMLELQKLDFVDPEVCWNESVTISKKADSTNHLFGLAFVLVAVLGYTMMAFFAKLLFNNNPDLGPWDILLVRSLLATTFIGIQAKATGIDLLNFKQNGVFLASAVVVRTICIFVYLTSSQYISVTKSTLIMYSNPAVVVLLTYFFLKEKITKTDILSIISVMIGWALITQDGANGTPADESLFGYFLAILSWITMGMALTMWRVLGQILSPIVFVFYYSLFTLFLSLIVFGTTDIIDVMAYSLLDLIILILVGIGGIIGSLFAGLALKYMEATKLSPFWHLEIVSLCFWEGVFLGYEFVFTDYVGGGLIMGTLILVILVKLSNRSK